MSEAGRSAGAADDAPRCEALTLRGVPCRSFTLPGRPYCIAHDPEQEETRRAGRAKGGAQASKVRSLKGRRAKLSTVPGLTRFVATVVHEVLEGDITPDVARAAIAGLALQHKLVEAGDLEQRLAALEALYGAPGVRAVR